MNRSRTRSFRRTISGVVAGTLAVEGQPVELHVHRVGNWVIRKDRELLEDDREVPVHRRSVALFRMHDEGANHAHHFLHRHVRVVEERACLMQRKFVYETSSRRDRILAAPRRPVHVHRDLKSVPVHRGGLREMVLEDDSHVIALGHLDGWARGAAVVSPQADGFAGNQFLRNWFSNETKLLRAIDHAPGELRDVGRFHGNRHAAVSRTGVRLTFEVSRRPRCTRQQLRRRRKAGAQTKNIFQKIAPVLHQTSFGLTSPEALNAVGSNVAAVLTPWK